ncbi:unnamed protein product [Microthlaspi erraticum]|uniref:Uncharacterized protein n=1 Tax=Microthlaspi erraticum TaxID=1685480 RepID=A0A6D2JV44_9BRAS|nr:unnamed protein product [Microthlaspi erraticum]
MTSTSSTTSLYPTQQQPLQPLGSNYQIEPTASNANLVAAPNAPNHYSSGSIGPFFAVISVVVLLAILSCFLGRLCARRRLRMVSEAESNPLDMIKGGGLLGWLRRKWRRCLAGDVEAGAKVADCAGKETPKDGDQTRLETPPA